MVEAEGTPIPTVPMTEQQADVMLSLADELIQNGRAESAEVLLSLLQGELLSPEFMLDQQQT